MENYQIFALGLGFLGLYSFINKERKTNRIARLVDEDKFERKRLLEKYYSIYLAFIVILSSIIWNSPIISNFIYQYFNKSISNMQISISIYILFIILALYLRKFFNPKSKNNKNIIAISNSTFKLPPKKLNIGILEGFFLNKKLLTFFSFVVRTDDYTIQKVKFNNEAILLKKHYIMLNFKKNRFDEDDYDIIRRVEEEISSRNKYEFKDLKKMENRVAQLIRAIQSQKKFTYSFGQIKQYSNSIIIDEILLFLQELQENRYSDDSLPYLLYYKSIIK